MRLLAVYVHAWLQRHLVEWFVRFQSLFHAHSLHTLFAASTLLCLCTAYLLYFNLVSTSSSSFGVCATYSDLLLLQLCFVFALWFNIDFSLCCLPLAAVPLKDKESLFSTLSDSWPYAPDFAVNLLLPGTQSWTLCVRMRRCLSTLLQPHFWPLNSRFWIVMPSCQIFNVNEGTLHSVNGSAETRLCRCT